MKASQTPNLAMTSKRRTRNIAFKPVQPAYDRLIERLSRQLAAASGNLVEDDFNHLAQLYNTCAHLCRIIDTRGLHTAYVDLWRAHLASQLVTEGKPADIAGLARLLRSIPTQGRFVEFTRAATSTPASLKYNKAAYIYAVTADSLDAALSALEPGYAIADSSARKRWRAFLDNINPWLTGDSSARFWFPVGAPAADSP